jgi:hypothetical protein
MALLIDTLRYTGEKGVMTPQMAIVATFSSQRDTFWCVAMFCDIGEDGMAAVTRSRYLPKDDSGKFESALKIHRGHCQVLGFTDDCQFQLAPYLATAIGLRPEDTLAGNAMFEDYEYATSMEALRKQDVIKKTEPVVSESWGVEI